jgi:hypothetical protein
VKTFGAHEACMYRIELSPGDETVFRSIEELAVAIKRGVVTSRARIFHNASSRWLPIQFHPHYKAALSLPLTQAALVAGPQSKPLSTLKLELPPDPEPATEAEVALPLPPARSEAAKAESAPDAPAVKKKKASSPRLKGESRSRRASKPRRQLRIALVGALLLGGAQWVLSVPLVSRTQPALLADLQRQLTRAHAEAMKQVGSPNTAAMIPVLPTTASAGTPEVLQQPSHRVTTPSFGGTSVGQATAELEPAPATPELGISNLPVVDSARTKLVDSTSHRRLQGILTTVSGGGTPPVPAASKR